MRLHWVHKHDGIGSAFGYSTHEKNLMKALASRGVEFTGLSPVSIHLMPPYYFYGFKTKRNVLFSMLEFDRFPQMWKSFLDKADLVIVPCEHNRRVFQAATNRPVEVCQEGINPEVYTYRKRSVEGTFTFLYIGDNNPRKGTTHIVRAWELWNRRYPDLAKDTQLIMKMTSPDAKQELRQITVNSYIDFRVLPLTDDDSGLPSLVSLYHFAHCFLFPTMGEGWGLTLAEAMATGLPSIFTCWSGPEHFANEDTGYPVEYGFQEVNLKDPYGGSVATVGAADPSIDSIVDRMREVYLNYDAALEKGIKAAHVMHNYFTWDQSALRLIEIMNGRYGEAVA